MLDEITIRGKASPYQGPLDVHSYCAAYGGNVALLASAARELETGAG